MTQGNLRKIRTKNYQGSEEEWNDLIAYVFLRKRPDGKMTELMRGLETVAALSTEAQTITISLRKSLGGITQRLASVELVVNDEQAIELFEWAGTAADATDAIESQLSSVSAKFEEQQIALAKLNSQLQDLIKAKEEHERVLLEKLMELLNAKKLKIRDQQRLLAGAKVEPDKGELATAYFTRLSNENRSGTSAACPGHYWVKKAREFPSRKAKSTCTNRRSRQFRVR